MASNIGLFIGLSTTAVVVAILLIILLFFNQFAFMYILFIYLLAYFIFITIYISRHQPVACTPANAKKDATISDNANTMYEVTFFSSIYNVILIAGVGIMLFILNIMKYRKGRSNSYNSGSGYRSKQYSNSSF